MPRSGRPKLIQTQQLRLTQNLTAAMRLLRFDASGLTRYLEEQAVENPALRIGAPDVDPGEWLPRWSGVIAAQGRGAAGPGGDQPVAERATAAGPSLMAHVTAEIDRMFNGPAAREQAMVFALALEPSGWLGRPLAQLAADAGLTPDEGEALLRRLQDIEPAGLFARNLRECLELQAREAGWLDPPMAVMLAHLDRVAAGDLTGLARMARVPVEVIAQCLRHLRGLNPKPGTIFDPGAAMVREPDLLVTKGPGGWTVAVNRGALPALRVADVPRGARQPGGDRAAASGICRLVEARGTMLLRVAGEVLRRQDAMLDRGATALVPMTMAEVAEALELHESTVSRAVAGVSIDTPRGTLWLRALFSGAAGGAGAAAAVRARLADLVASEDPRAPFSDADLAARLAGEGETPPARRTVAKYRGMLAIPAAHRRRRKA